MHDRIYHNPRCSKSRATLELLKQRGVDIPVIEYQSAPPSKDELREVITLLGVKPLDIIRSGDDLFADLGLSTANGYSDEQWLDVLAANPKLLQRPIVVRNGKAAIGRPIENVMAIL
ncbi:arsenate reductase (glutaredoxin) [Sinimarinibacterium sp. NLF-5-8]|uniref:arsenate reductase (glutaredoxin) n=1 Tax=Sinimarinibacterium sp. NLF-5-8 TaxID=2698684 RepID=UPI00137BA131|nr:arsenate reductase (glutaredoxin) [Sinimarinibacterium sp. NLF-5-8]QHS11191.1 arsenate reductase (glutaredoxin) [Sinimarinibacterium sp. NLF-5-8]